MAFLDKMVKKDTSVDIEEFLNNMDVEEEALYDNADAFVKPFNLNTPEDAKAIVDEAKQGNIVLIDIGDISKRNAIRLKEMITSIKNEVSTIDGDIARISHERVLVTPSKVKIIKQKNTR